MSIIFYSRVAAHKPLIEKMNARLRVQCCKNHVEKKWIWSEESSLKGIQWLCHAGGGMLLAWFGSMCP